ncbi:MAG: hypothetical protein WC836_00250 [Desulfobacula sp.]|jgi:hypothetical protein
MKANAVEFLAEERKKLQSALAALQAQKQASTGDKKLRKELAQLCKRAKKDDSPELIEGIIALLEKMRDHVSIQDLDKTIQEHEQLIMAFNQVLGHYGYVEEKSESKIPVPKPAIAGVDSVSMVPQQSGKGARIAERKEILRQIILAQTKDGKAPLDLVFKEFKSRVTLAPGFSLYHLGVLLNCMGYSFNTKENSITLLGVKTKFGSKISHNYRDKVLALFLSLGIQNQISSEQLFEESQRFGLLSDNKDKECFKKYLYKHSLNTLLENRLFELVKAPSGKGRKATGGIFSLTSLGKKLVAKHQQELQSLLGDKLKTTNTKKGE